MSANVSTRTAPAAPPFDRILDVRPMNCPLPILRTKAEFAKMQTGQVLKVIYRQQEYVRELEMFARQSGNHVIHTAAGEGHHAAWIEKA